LTECKCSTRRNNIGKEKPGSRERNEGGKQANRNSHRKGMKARKETKGKQGKNGRDQATITP
jgi:hypothetical protein